MVLLLCDQRLLLVMLMQLLLQFLGGCCCRLCLRRGADRLGHECACRSLAAAVVGVVVVVGTVTAALAAALCVTLMALATLLRARLVDACYGVRKTGFRGGKVALRPELAAKREREGGSSVDIHICLCTRREKGDCD